MKLTNEKHEAFAQEYCLNGGNAAAAARHVGVTAHATARGSDMIHRKEVLARVAELSGNMPVRLANRVGSATINDLQNALTRLLELCPTP